jgi:hypothetical protein
LRQEISSGRVEIWFPPKFNNYIESLNTLKFAQTTGVV